MFLAHLDTVFAPGVAAEWPLTVDEDGIGHGPGCVDCKGGCLSIYYLLRAMLAAGECSLKAIGELYDKIGARFGRSGRTVERDIRYAVARCWERRRVEEGRPGNAQFLAKLMEECDSVKPTLITPRVSVFASGRRVFR